ncbi:MAG TPA: HNH endonuclease signature motif containing protein [Solirubrobacter sp.]|nr:HNH endonuclease signature motif containing protein [Solirubrobacter sp.]
MPRLCVCGCGTVLAKGSRCQASQPLRKRNGWADQRVRAQVLTRDGARCSVPDCATPRDRLEVHHVVALEDGGSDDASNRVVLCHGHHLAETRRRRQRAP